MDRKKRDKNKVEKHCSSRDFWDFYKTRASQRVKNEHVYFKILHDLFKTVSDNILYKSYIYEMPWGGVLYIRRYYPKVRIKVDGTLNKRKSYMSVDWKKTLALWEEYPEKAKKKVVCYHLNNHTKGYKYRWCWDKYGIGRFKNKTYYRFTTCRKNSRRLAEILKTPDRKIEYFE